MVEIIVDYFNEVITKKITHVENYVMDLAIIGEMQEEVVYFIEINSFGADYSSGSALFHWKHDEAILLNDRDNNVVFRYTSDN